MTTPPRPSHRPLALAVVLVLALAAAPSVPALETLTNREGSVTVKVTPRNIVPGAKTWDFEISLSTHTVPLDQDMARAAVLIGGSGPPQMPLAWEGDPPGGHHREGVLRFQPPSVLPQIIELDINRVGEVKRVFRWRLAR